MLEAVKVTLDPTPRQERLLESHAGAARFAYNKGLAHVRDVLERGDAPEWSYYALRKWWNQAKDALAVDEATGEPWWPENSKEAYNSGLESLADALKNFSDSGIRRFAYTTGSFGPVDHDSYALKLPRIGRVHCMEDASKRVDGAKVLRMSVSRRAGRWQASLTVERADDPAPKPPKGGSVGIDLGVKELATLSDGTVIRNPHALKSNLTRLRKAQRSLSRKRKGSNRRRKARANVARLHARVANLRRDLLDKTTTMLAHTYADISIEDLNVAGMVKNHGLAQSIHDAAFAEFRRQLTYKTARTGTRLHVIDRWHPSSKTCSNCGTVKTKLSLSERVYHCDKCGLSIDRDLNAAINIQVAGSAPETINARGGSGRQTRPKGGTMRHPAKREPSGGESRVRLGAGLGNEAMQMTSL